MKSPWTILNDRGRTILIGVAGPTADEIVATVNKRGDANLIVRAPVLAAEVDTLRSEVASLRAALEDVVRFADVIPPGIIDRARAALEGAR